MYAELWNGVKFPPKIMFSAILLGSIVGVPTIPKTYTADITAASSGTAPVSYKSLLSICFGQNRELQRSRKFARVLTRSRSHFITQGAPHGQKTYKQYYDYANKRNREDFLQEGACACSEAYKRMFAML